MNRRPLRILAAGALALMLGACSTPSNYFEERVYDLEDIVDVKWACDIFSFGIGAKVELTNYVNAGLGYGSYDEVVEQFGRRASHGSSDFLHLVAYGLDGTHKHNLPGPATEHNVAFINCCQEKRPPMVDRFRFGAEVLVLGIDAGLYLNTGELLDFLLGLATIDIADDDRMAWNTEW